MAKIKIGNTREIELLDAIKNPSAINFKVGNKYAELTDDITKTNGSPQLKFSKNGNEYYIREKFKISGNWSLNSLNKWQTKDITSQFPDFSIHSAIKYLTCQANYGTPMQVVRVPETGDFRKNIDFPFFTVSFIRKGGTLTIANISDFNIGMGIYGSFTIEQGGIYE